MMKEVKKFCKPLFHRVKYLPWTPILIVLSMLVRNLLFLILLNCLHSANVYRLYYQFRFDFRVVDSILFYIYTFGWLLSPTSIVEGIILFFGYNLEEKPPYFILFCIFARYFLFIIIIVWSIRVIHFHPVNLYMNNNGVTISPSTVIYKQKESFKAVKFRMKSKLNKK